MDEFQGDRIARAEKGNITAYILQNNSGISHEIDVLSQKGPYNVKPDEGIVALNFSSGTGLEPLAPLNEVESLLSEEHFFVIDGDRHSVSCHNCSDFTRKHVFVHEDNTVPFSVHPRCLKNIRRVVEELLDSVQIIAHTI